jgi:hypothetical protein
MNTGRGIHRGWGVVDSGVGTFAPRGRTHRGPCARFQREEAPPGNRAAPADRIGWGHVVQQRQHSGGGAPAGPAVRAGPTADHRSRITQKSTHPPSVAIAPAVARASNSTRRRIPALTRHAGRPLRFRDSREQTERASVAGTARLYHAAERRGPPGFKESFFRG